MFTFLLLWISKETNSSILSMGKKNKVFMIGSYTFFLFTLYYKCVTGEMRRGGSYFTEALLLINVSSLIVAFRHRPKEHIHMKGRIKYKTSFYCRRLNTTPKRKAFNAFKLWKKTREWPPNSPRPLDARNRFFHNGVHRTDEQKMHFLLISNECQLVRHNYRSDDDDEDTCRANFSFGITQRTNVEKKNPIWFALIRHGFVYLDESSSLAF